MTRRALLSLPLAFRLRADSAADVWDLFTSLASALSDSNVSGFMGAFDPAMPVFQQLRDNVTALVREVQVQSSIEILKNEGDDRGREVELDWLMDLVQAESGAASARREQNVSARLGKTGAKWRITSIEPVAFFAPPPGTDGSVPRRVVGAARR
jgi:hypothetical protein